MGTISDSIRANFPAGMCPIHGVVGAFGGLVLFITANLTIFHTSYAYAWFPPWYSFMLLIVMLAGICAAVWYVVGRPLAFRLREPRPAGDQYRSFSPQFSRGMVLAVIGGVLPLFVNGGSGLWMQTLGILGAVLLIVAPLWYWLVGAVEWSWREWWPDALPTPSGRQAGLAGVALLVAASVALTLVVALPVLPVDETATNDGVAVTITDVQQTQSVVGLRDDRNHGHNDTVTAAEDTELLVIEFTVENRAGEPREAPHCVGFCQATQLISPGCGTWYDPDCPDETPHIRNFTAGGREYDTYNSLVTLAPGEENTGAVVYEVPRHSDGGERPQLTFVVHEIGRWDVSADS